MLIGKITASKSHSEYVIRVNDKLAQSPSPEKHDFTLGKFVSIKLDPQTTIIAVVYNSMLYNPEYGNFSPRLSPDIDLAVLAPDFLNEKGVVLEACLLGWANENNEYFQEIPEWVIPVNEDVGLLTDQEFADFHKAPHTDSINIHYYSRIMNMPNQMGANIMRIIIEKLYKTCSDHNKQKLNVIKKQLIWKQTFGKF